MSSAGLLALSFVAMAFGAAAQTRTTFACPENVDHGSHAFLNASVYNGTPGKDEYELKPDNEARHGNKVTLSWNLKDYRDMNLFTRCRYHDTSTTVTKDLPAQLTTCSVTLELNARHDIVGKSQMSCH
jgi:hypothetical protein